MYLLTKLCILLNQVLLVRVTIFATLTHYTAIVSYKDVTTRHSVIPKLDAEVLVNIN